MLLNGKLPFGYFCLLFIFQLFCTFVKLKRTLHIFFAIYFAMLAITPCGDKTDCNDLKKSDICQSSHEHDQESHEDEDCTPLCTCSCCAALFVIKESPSCKGEGAEINTIYTFHDIAPEAGVVIPIWQPPKIS